MQVWKSLTLFNPFSIAVTDLVLFQSGGLGSGLHSCRIPPQQQTWGWTFFSFRSLLFTKPWTPHKPLSLTLAGPKYSVAQGRGEHDAEVDLGMSGCGLHHRCGAGVWVTQQEGVNNPQWGTRELKHPCAVFPVLSWGRNPAQLHPQKPWQAGLWARRAFHLEVSAPLGDWGDGCCLTGFSLGLAKCGDCCGLRIGPASNSLASS